MNVDLDQADDDLEGSEEELEVAGREWRRMEERSLKEGFRSDAVLQPWLVFEPIHFILCQRLRETGSLV